MATTLLANLPELWTLTHKQIAALVGVARLNRDNGTLRGKRTVYQRLCAAGKSKKGGTRSLQA